MANLKKGTCNQLERNGGAKQIRRRKREEERDKKRARIAHAESTAVLDTKNAGTLYVSNINSVSFSLFCLVFHYRTARTHTHTHTHIDHTHTM